MTTYKLSYFPVITLGEPIRATFVLGGTEFEDERIPVDGWKDLKNDPNGRFFGRQLPCLEVKKDGETKRMFQGRAILRYVGKICRYEGRPLYPEDPMEALLCDEIIELAEDARSHLTATYALATAAEKESTRAALVKPDGKIYANLSKLDEKLGQSRFAAGDSPSIADLYAVMISHLFQAPSLYAGFPEDSLKPFPNIIALKERVMSLPPLAKYYENAEGMFAHFKVSK